jgi:hypothetical protein
VIPFDKDGMCEGPHTREHLVSHAGDFTDIFVFSHGWNNDWTAATSRYEHFINGFTGLRKARGLAVPAYYRPVLVGVFWPSQALAWFDSETGPDIAAADPAAQNAAAEAATATLRDIASSLPASRRARFYELAQARSLDASQARELAEMLASLTAPDDEGPRADQPSADDLLAAAASMTAQAPDLDAVGTVEGGGAAIEPQAAAGLGDLLGVLDPRNLLKPFTVWSMKDRAGVVGARGVSPLVADLLTRSQARVHLLGHSFGCKVVMTAVARLPAGLRPVESALLLQPAVSQYAFAGRVPERGVPGGFFNTLTRVRRPIVATFSDDDVALRRGFHLAVRRHDDAGELQAAGATSLYGALGGFGPLESNASIETIRGPIAAYDLQGTGRIVGVNGTGIITGHGEISNEATWWLAYSLATAHLRLGA